MSELTYVRAVIGANYGDEGKGATVDFIARQFPNHSIDNIKSNGTAQAGHTVKSADNKFVFSHIGAASFNDNVYTVIADPFYLHPLMLLAEADRLNAIVDQDNVYDKLIISSYCPVVLSIDVAINRAIEYKRQQNKSEHGSCGLGFFEAVNRTKNANLRYSIFTDESPNWGTLNEYFKYRCSQLGLTDRDFVDSRTDQYITEEAFNVDKFMLDIIYHQVSVGDYWCGFENDSPFVVKLFENAQGLLLDKDSDRFPHVTPSITGSKYIAESLSRIADKNLDVEIIYATRPYLTKHGAGPFPELDAYGIPELDNFEDTTNAPNQWQGSLRLAVQNFDDMMARCKADFQHVKAVRDDAKLVISLTCCDQILDTGITAVINGKLQKCYIDELISFFKLNGADKVIMFEAESVGHYV